MHYTYVQAMEPCLTRMASESHEIIRCLVCNRLASGFFTQKAYVLILRLRRE